MRKVKKEVENRNQVSWDVNSQHFPHYYFHDSNIHAHHEIQKHQ